MSYSFSRQLFFAKELRSLYHKDNPNSYQFELFKSEITYADIINLKLNHPKNKIGLKKIENINSPKIESVVTNFYLPENLPEKISFIEKTGIFKITLSDNSFIYLAKWSENNRDYEALNSLFAAELKTWKNFLRLIHSKEKLRQKPPIKGAYNLIWNRVRGDVEYIKLNRIQNTKIIHPIKDEVFSDINFYFKNVARFTKYNMSGIRKVLFIGEPGTGKSTLCYNIFNKLKKEFLVVVSHHIYEVIEHALNCTYNKTPSIIILEDADTSLEEANSSMLNFLDGFNQPQTSEGVYVIFTTNFPKKIHPRILKRPGRVDKIFLLDSLHENYAYECSKLYFSRLFSNKLFESLKKDEIISIFDGLTGAQIKELSYATASYLNYKNLSEGNLNYDVISLVKNEMLKNLKDLEKYAYQESIDKKDPIGFDAKLEQVRRKY
jgi:SpoVK/Ycf46/Vps4 family AAA+-type ATPase